MRRLLILLVAIGASAQPRPIGDAERAAVSIVASYLAEGPRAIHARLTADTPLRALPEADAIREIAVRTGPREGATWTLQTVDREGDAAFRVRWPSGFEDGLLFRMKGDRVDAILILAESPPRKTVPLPSPSRTMAVAAAVLALAGAVMTARWRYLGVAVLGLAGAAAVIAYREATPRSAVQARFVELRVLAPLREALARGVYAQIPRAASRDARDVATLWLLQSGAAVEVGGTKDDPIAALGSVAATPLAHLVRARIALASNDELEAARAFEQAAAIPPMRDDILHEAAFSFGNDRANPFLARLRTMRSRDAETWYRGAAETGSFDDLRTAWTLAPKPREELIRLGLAADLRTQSLISFFSASEPVRRSASLATRSLAWPRSASVVVNGELLRIELGRSVLEVPNGAALAPADARVVAATWREQQREATDLRDAQELLEHGGTASRTRLTRAVRALARRNRWTDVAKLTAGIADNAPAEVLVLRLRALLRTDRVNEARELAESRGVREVAGPAAVVAIGEAMSNAGQWGTAEALFRSVQTEKERPVVELRLRQLALRRTLATSSQVITTTHFVIRHDAAINPAIASRIGDFLEAELARLRAAFPPFEPRPVTVNVLHWDEFRGGITGSDHILGLYDGEIIFPFAAVEQFKPAVVAVITHELTHAVIAQVTGDNAPRWFQEGVASRMELVDRQENAFATMPPDAVLPVTLLDAVMEKNSDASAYVVAQTFIRFLEDRYGADATARLASDFARGMHSDDALTKLAGKPLDTLNTEFRQWGFHNNGEFVRTEPWPYHELYSPGIDPRIRAGFKFGKKEP